MDLRCRLATVESIHPDLATSIKHNCITRYVFRSSDDVAARVSQLSAHDSRIVVVSRVVLADGAPHAIFAHLYSAFYVPVSLGIDHAVGVGHQTDSGLCSALCASIRSFTSDSYGILFIV